jgi:hypothetical protein
MAVCIPIILRSLVTIVVCMVLFSGCSSLIIHDDDNAAVVGTKVAVRTVNCALTIFAFCMSEWWLMEDAKASSMVWYGTGDINGDNYTCQKEATYGSSGATGYVHMPIGKNVVSMPMAGGGGQQMNQQLYHSCMRARGYQLYDSYELNKWREKQAIYNSVKPSQSEEDANVQNNRGTQFHNGQGVPQDYVQARHWYEKSAARGNAFAQVNLGVLYQNGLGVQQDFVQARQLYEKSAAQGNSIAQANLGVLYHDGLGVPRDYVQARQWYEHSAAQGNALAEACLGILYHNGLGVPQNLVLARQWYERSAGRGNSTAQANLGVLYHNGLGGSQDLVRAHFWLSVAAVQSGNNSAAQERDKVMTEMTPEQRTEAQQLFQKCQAQQFKDCGVRTDLSN